MAYIHQVLDTLGKKENQNSIWDLQKDFWTYGTQVAI